MKLWLHWSLDWLEFPKQTMLFQITLVRTGVLVKEFLFLNKLYSLKNVNPTTKFLESFVKY